MELLVVLVVISILAGITISVSKLVSWRAKQAQSEAELQKIKNALEEYRAIYGEYPIVGDARHYGFPPNAPWPANVYQPVPWDDISVPTDMWTGTYSNVPPEYRTVNLVESCVIMTNAGVVTTNFGIEVLPFAWAGSSFMVDYRLTYPLKIRPELEGRKAFMDFPVQTVCVLTWRGGGHEVTVTDARGLTFTYLSGDRVNRVRAIDPATSKQWFYDCTNGMTYTLSSANGFL